MRYASMEELKQLDRSGVKALVGEIRHWVEGELL
jgi:hypothetical protein